MNDESLREKLGSIRYDHHLDPSSDNLGQYKAKHYCVCGLQFVTDGHDSYEIGANARFEFHILDKQMEIIKSHDQQITLAAREDLLFDLDEIDNKPWRVFRQLAKIMPEYADIYTEYEAFYAYGGNREVRNLIDEFKKTDDYKESGFPEKIATLKENKQ